MMRDERFPLRRRDEIESHVARRFSQPRGTAKIKWQVECGDNRLVDLLRTAAPEQPTFIVNQIEWRASIVSFSYGLEHSRIVRSFAFRQCIGSRRLWASRNQAATDPRCVAGRNCGFIAAAMQ